MNRALGSSLALLRRRARGRQQRADDQHLWVSDGVTNKILKYSLDGKLLSAWGTYGQFPGGLWGGHQISVDADGNLYVAEVFNGRAQKLRPKRGADPKALVGRPLPLAGPNP